jgi:hypothetical protein
MLKVNAFIIEAERHLVIAATTLTMSDSKMLKQKAEQFLKISIGQYRNIYFHQEIDL